MGASIRWKPMYVIHKTSPEIKKSLSSVRIGFKSGRLVLCCFK
jgi:hypothetical protein